MRKALVFTCATLLFSCGEIDQNKIEEIGKNINTQEAAPVESARCPNGEIHIHTGVDDNNNGLLEDSEQDNFKVVCKKEPVIKVPPGEGGYMPLAMVTHEPRGGDCVDNWGKKVNLGYDYDRSGGIDDNETYKIMYICTANSIKNPIPFKTVFSTPNDWGVKVTDVTKQISSSAKFFKGTPTTTTITTVGLSFVNKKADYSRPFGRVQRNINKYQFELAGKVNSRSYCDDTLDQLDVNISLDEEIRVDVCFTQEGAQDFVLAYEFFYKEYVYFALK